MSLGLPRCISAAQRAASADEFLGCGGGGQRRRAASNEFSSVGLSSLERDMAAPAAVARGGTGVLDCGRGPAPTPAPGQRRPEL
eukprot:11213525-Lingulodinium_polyedra.AAC.1